MAPTLLLLAHIYGVATQQDWLQVTMRISNHWENFEKILAPCIGAARSPRPPSIHVSHLENSDTLSHPHVALTFSNVLLQAYDLVEHQLFVRRIRIHGLYT